MKVLDLFCVHQHAFEGWFASEEDFQQQQARGLVQCPMCGSADIRKGLSAPRLNLRASTDAPSPTQAAARPAPASREEALQTLQTAWLHAARQIMARTEDVGGRFAAEARRMHYGEIEERAIRGQATQQEAAELLDEGIAVLPLPIPEAAKETLQ
ncbi:hypothetical protein ALDI51_11770 [Alicycliphilus denitrificans]|uniref:DUF1178 family protein n=1 Tax=Alicycliphilus denitrificans TaxID=179636 RepID=UPI00191693E4|nr:DUF1178 family protein [Alicycliphilus denitrificans]MBN9572380.1 DUF1178 family protein [Alicycliphilus denitrificans]BCN37858.1 hypothetical protein ALDI51_11770 [Alicycliphilus denitrificans]